MFTMPMTWWAFPLAAVVSLVWNCSRFEHPGTILARALRMFVLLSVFFVATAGLLYALSMNL